MKKITFTIAFLAIFFSAFSQDITSIDYFKWSDPITYNLSPSPYIKGYGHYSDSLSNAYDNKDFYEYNDEYYCIESWADYYYWFTKKYWHLFENPAVYEYYYWTKNDLGMASYIASYSYLGEYYPSSIKLIFKNKDVENRLATNKYIAYNETQFSRLKSQRVSTTNDRKIIGKSGTSSGSKKTYTKSNSPTRKVISVSSSSPRPTVNQKPQIQNKKSK